MESICPSDWRLFLATVAVWTAPAAAKWDRIVSSVVSKLRFFTKIVVSSSASGEGEISLSF